MSKRRGATLAGVIALAGCDAVEQPLAFNHAKHVEQSMECSDCHQHYQTAAFSGLPRLEVCAGCHDQPVSDSQDEKVLFAFVEKREEIPWQRVYRLPDHVFYSHRRHVVVAGLECKTCHGDIAALSEPPARPLVDQSMDWCIECHTASGATLDCIHCHR